MDYEVRGCILIVDGNAIDLNSVVHITDIFKGGVAPIYTFSINYGLHGSEEINVYVIDEERRKHIV